MEEDPSQGEETWTHLAVQTCPLDIFFSGASLHQVFEPSFVSGSTLVQSTCTLGHPPVCAAGEKFLLFLGQSNSI